MDPTDQGAAGLEPLLQRALGDPSLAAFGCEELDRITKATEMVVAEIAAGARAEAGRERSAVRLRADQAVAHRRLELQGIRSELIDRATALAIRFEALLDEVDSAEAELAQGAAGTPEPAGEDEAAMATGERRDILGSGGGEPQPVVFEHQRAPARTAAVESVRRRRWWHRLRGEAA